VGDHRAAALPRTDQPEGDQNDRPADDDVREPVIAGAHHVDGHRQRVEQPHTLDDTRHAGIDQYQRHPQRPPCVQRRESSQLIGQMPQSLGCRGIGAPPTDSRVQAQDVGESAEHARRRRGEAQVERQADQGGDDECATRCDVLAGAATIQPEQGQHSDGVVRRRVPVAADQPEPVVVHEQPVQPALNVDAPRHLEGQQVEGVTAGGRVLS